MNPDRESPRDESDEALDRVILAATAQPPPVEIKHRVIESAAALTSNDQAGWWRTRGRSWVVGASAALTVAAVCAITLLLLPSSSAVGWEEVTAAVQSQSWIRMDGRSSTTWLSPERQVWAFRADKQFIFIDGRERAKYVFRAGARQIEKTAMSEEDTRLISPVDYVSQGPWLFGTERVVSQQSRSVRDAGKKWIEFDLVFWRGDMNLGTLRVDPETRLPAYLLLRSRTDAAKSMRYEFAYSGSGPADIYALGVPAETKIDDRMPPKDAQRVLEALAASRSRIGDFRLVVAPLREGQTGRFGGPGAYIVWRKGDRWRIDLGVSESGSGQKTDPPGGHGWGDPFIEKLKLSWRGPLYLCDGRTVYANANLLARSFEKPKADAKGGIPIAWQRSEAVAPRDLLSGEGLGSMPYAFKVKIASMVYPDLSRLSGWSFEFDPRPPAPGMPGSVLIKRSAQLATQEPMVGHEWYYLDPTKGYAVVRVELFNLPAGTPPDPRTAPGRQTIRMEDFQQSPQGFWYPSTILESNVDIGVPGLGPPAKQKNGPEVRYHTSSVHYHFDFNVALPDELFAK